MRLPFRPSFPLSSSSFCEFYFLCADCRSYPRLGADVDDAGGDGPGSFDVRGNVWHLNCCNPENNFDNDGWSIFNAIFGWTNSATIGSVLSYVFYWLAVMVVLVIMKWKEGRVKLFGIESAAGVRRREYDDAIQVREAEREAAAAAAAAGELKN